MGGPGAAGGKGASPSHVKTKTNELFVAIGVEALYSFHLTRIRHVLPSSPRSSRVVAPGNWGDPAGGACATHLPVIRAAGNLTLRGGRGHGTIIAAGDVVFEQGATFAGLVIAGDDFVTGPGGGTVLGAVLAGDGRRGPQDHSVVTDGGLVRRSTCRVRLARLAAAPPMRVRDRWWAEFD